jgi:hypothetical protein
MEAGSMAVESRETEEYGGLARLRVGLLEIYRSEFEKLKSKNFKKMTDPPKGTEGGSRFRRMVDGGEANVPVIEREILQRGGYGFQNA